MQRAPVQGGKVAPHDVPDRLRQVREVELVARRADEDVDLLLRPVGERHRAAVDRRDRGAARDPAVRHLREVVLAQGESRDQDVLAGRGRAEGGGMAGHAEDPLAQPSAEGLARQPAPLQRAEQRVPLPVRRDAVDDLLDDVARLAEGRHDRRDGREVGREVGRDLQPADAVAVDEHALVAERLGARVVEGVQALAGEAVEPRGDARPAEAPRGHDEGVEGLAVHLPAGLDGGHGRVEPDPRRDAEAVRVRAQVGVDLLGGGVQRQVGGSREVRERGHRPARVRAHARPHAAVGGGGVPLTAEVAARLEHGGVEAGLERVLRGGQAARPGADDRHPRARSQSHGPDASRSRGGRTGGQAGTSRAGR